VCIAEVNPGGIALKAILGLGGGQSPLVVRVWGARGYRRTDRARSEAQQAGQESKNEWIPIEEESVPCHGTISAVFVLQYLVHGILESPAE